MISNAAMAVERGAKTASKPVKPERQGTEQIGSNNLKGITLG